MARLDNELKPVDEFRACRTKALSPTLSQREREQEELYSSNAFEEVIDTLKQKLYTLLICNDWLNGPNALRSTSNS